MFKLLRHFHSNDILKYHKSQICGSTISSEKTAKLRINK
jgi:hypothetical protein